MKVMCIDARPNYFGVIPEVIEGHEYTVVGKSIIQNGNEHFDLAETIYRYATWRFIPLSDIDENELFELSIEQQIRFDKALANLSKK